ncbi:unnamed protein product [Meloidogyne enterolobii]|uniref:Uncharacterized protein n=1 Tax=Meloidogyne enterolobii TaxID=390850 RepID=A0ACB1A8K2_MELEN
MSYGQRAFDNLLFIEDLFLLATNNSFNSYQKMCHFSWQQDSFYCRRATSRVFRSK